MRFDVLGPLRVRTEGGALVPVAEPKVRALLADLLVHHGRPVPVDRLVDDLWGEDAPGNPSNSLQTKVSQLRRALERAEEGGRALVGYGPAGYVLRVPEDAVDSGRFARLTARARRESDPRTKASSLSEALGLWRGAAFADFRDAAFVQAAVAGLEEQRLTAQEDLAELRLELGEHQALADELGPLVAEHPLRQRLRGVHLRALYRAGRQSEALEAYQVLRLRLAEELGIDPAPELAALHRAMLRQDPGLGPGSAPATTARPRTNLPAPVSSLVGRRNAVDRVCELVGAHRLVTLTGPGGVGKTRLALEAAARLADGDAYADGVWLVELAGARGEVAETVAAVLDVRDDAAPGMPGGDAGGDPVPDRLAEALRTRRLLLVLDNCEHVVGPVAALVGRLLRGAPGLRVLATSQEPLAVPGEVLDDVAPLAEAEAVELFAARAAATAPGFALEPGNAEAVALICRRLDGIPLALELAATRVRALGVHALAARLHDRFRLLHQVRRDAPARQRTLRAMIDWSWELLSPPERTVLRRLAVFAGGFTAESAEAVCAVRDAGDVGNAGGDADVRAEDVLDVVTRLVDRSLIVPAYGADGSGGSGDLDGPRYRLLESVAAYGLERLDEAGETKDTLRRHVLHYTGLAERAAPLLHGRDQRHWLHRLDAETLNLRAALDRAVTAGDGGAGLRLVNALTWYWYLRGRFGEAVRSLRHAVECADPGGALAADRAPGTAAAHTGPALASARVRRAVFALFTGDDPTADESFEGADAWGRWLLAFARCGFGEPTEDGGSFDALTAEFREAGDRWGEAAALSTLATQALYEGDLAAVRRNAAASAAIFAEVGDRWGQLQASEQLGVVAEVTGDYAAAARLHQDGVRGAEELQLWSHVSFRLARLGRIALLTGDDARAAELHERARRLAVEQSHRTAEQFAENGLALGARRRGDLDAAEALLRPWLEWNRRFGVDTGAALVLAQLGYAAEQRGDARRAEELHRDGLAAARRSGDPRAVALALEGLAGARAAAGRPEEAASLLGTAAAVRDSVGAPLPPAERADVDRAAGRAREALGEPGFAAAFARGRALTAGERTRLLDAAASYG
ncbi:BTAD domain-containing putative transcriptional regulator [Streptomyces sp.]|uniref:BTAD domain-containing putative transcriptional regulator n=1 Tax=Streptomyces sp. TaxID=1931 RepID=UPI0028117909|nr:BTAD domain-containing putative transcriptional regulator [Streptomyces sp.]